MNLKKIFFWSLILIYSNISAFKLSLHENANNELDGYYQRYPSKKLLAEAERVVDELEKSFYAYPTDINTLTEKYYCDCSSILFHFLALSLYKWAEKIYAYAVLTRHHHRKNTPPIRRPLAEDFTNFFINHNPELDIFKGWEVISYRQDLQPGDIIAIKYEDGSSSTGHVLILAGEPFQRSDFGGAYPTPAGYSEFLIRIIDSSGSPHGTSATDYPRMPDSRTNNPKNIDESGVGFGYMVLLTKDSDPLSTKRIHGWRRSNLSGSKLYRNEPSDLPSGSYTTRPIRFGRAISYDSNPEKYSDYYGVNVYKLEAYKNLATHTITDDSE